MGPQILTSAIQKHSYSPEENKYYRDENLSPILSVVIFSHRPVVVKIQQRNRPSIPHAYSFTNIAADKGKLCAVGDSPSKSLYSVVPARRDINRVGSLSLFPNHAHHTYTYTLWVWRISNSRVKFGKHPLQTIVRTRSLFFSFYQKRFTTTLIHWMMVVMLGPSSLYISFFCVIRGKFRPFALCYIHI